jgi:hypothetical protein
MTKFQIPNNNQLSIAKTKHVCTFGYLSLVIDYYLEFVAWLLEFKSYGGLYD